MDLKSAAKDILKTARSMGADAAEVFIQRSSGTKIDVCDRKVEATEFIGETGAGIRIIKGGRLGFAFTADFDPYSVKEAVSASAAGAQKTAPDDFNILPSPKKASATPKTFDNDIANAHISQKIALAAAFEERARSADPRVKKTERSSFGDGESEIVIVNSNGVEASFMSNFCGGSIEVIAEEGGASEAGHGMDYTTSFKELDPEKIGKEAAQKAVELLGARAIPSQKLDIVFEPEVGARFLAAISPLFSSEAVQKGRSLFAGKIGSAAASKTVTIIDDGLLEGGLGTSPYDGEGTPTSRTALIEGGVLRAFLYSAYTGAKEGRSSTGSAHRGSFKSLPDVSPSNLFFEPGEVSGEDIIRSTKKGLLVTRVMGMHTINPISGDFSVGAAGIMIEGGQKTFPVRGITIAGNLLDILSRIEAVGSDLRFLPLGASIGSPTLLIAGLSASGG